jgi:dynein heavy chain
MLIKHDLPVNKEETERCDTLRYSWEKLQVQTSEVQTELLQVQPQFKSELIENVKVFNDDCKDFYGNYDTVSIQEVRNGRRFISKECLFKFYMQEVF